MASEEKVPFEARRSQTVQLVVHEGIGSEDLFKAIGSILEMAGCRTCGLTGFDVSLVASNPAFEKVREIRGIEAVTVATHVGAYVR